MKEFSLADLGVFIGVVGGIITSILLTIQKSKCDKIKCCGAECHRDPRFNNDKNKNKSDNDENEPVENP
jgi:hypothetical protein|tara:strand:- start:1674 stop:1880 length:207 start_codon:yes stop_codon:yes gene_type:complete